MKNKNNLEFLLGIIQYKQTSTVIEPIIAR